MHKNQNTKNISMHIQSCLNSKVFLNDITLLLRRDKSSYTSKTLADFELGDECDDDVTVEDIDFTFPPDLINASADPTLDIQDEYFSTEQVDRQIDVEAFPAVGQQGHMSPSTPIPPKYAPDKFNIVIISAPDQKQTIKNMCSYH